MAKNNKQEISNNKEEGFTIEEFYEAMRLIKELKAKKIRSNTLEEKVQGLKIEVEEQKTFN